MMEADVVYRICLADGRTWLVRGAGEAGPWVDEFASVMGLEPSRDGQAPGLVFERLGPQDGHEADLLARRNPAPFGNMNYEEWNFRAYPGLVFYSHPGIKDVICILKDDSHDRRIEQMRRAMRPIYDGVLRSGGLPMHAALAETRGRGVFLAGVSGAGKSTCSRRLPPQWRVLGDDMALVVHSGDGQFSAHPVPTWSDLKLRNCERPCRIGDHVPLRAIFSIEQSKTDELLPLGGGAGAIVVAEAAMQVYRSLESRFFLPIHSPLKRMIFDNAVSIARDIPAYVLRVSLQGRFWEKIEGVLEEGEITRPLEVGA
jgi:SynChlorMet cassette protein ScmC